MGPDRLRFNLAASRRWHSNLYRPWVGNVSKDSASTFGSCGQRRLGPSREGNQSRCPRWSTANMKHLFVPVVLTLGGCSAIANGPIAVDAAACAAALVAGGLANPG